jgi:ABC-type Fe3+/spermidine/putrescine transport system ATPase subunit
VVSATLSSEQTKCSLWYSLTGYGQRPIEQLSGGEQQRVALARSLAVNPRLLMLDEPLGALDRALRERLMIDLRTILKRVGVTAVYVTHDQTEAYAISDQLVVMNQGHIEQKAPPEMVYEQPATPFVARFLGFENLVAGTVSKTAGRVDTAVIGSIETVDTLPPAGTAVTLLLRPRAAVPSTASHEETDINQIHGIVKAISFRGRYYQVWITVHEQTLVFDLPYAKHLQVGRPVSLTLQADKVQLIPQTPNPR